MTPPPPDYVREPQEPPRVPAVAWCIMGWALAIIAGVSGAVGWLL